MYDRPSCAHSPSDAAMAWYCTDSITATMHRLPRIRRGSMLAVVGYSKQSKYSIRKLQINTMYEQSSATRCG